MAAFGRTRTPGRLLNITSSGTFPATAGTYVSPDGAVTVPFGALDTWFNYSPSMSASLRRALVVFGDSTTYGSGGNYSWVSRLRDRAVSAGFTDGGKSIFGGLEQEIVYDSPEINGVVSSTFAGSTDSYDTLVGSWLFDAAGTPGHQSVTQFRETCLRLWYIKRFAAGDFTYSVSAPGFGVVASGTISAQQAGNPRAAFAYFTGLPAGVTKTLTIINTGGGEVHVAIDPINATGLVCQKQAMSGATFGGFFFGGLTPSAPFTDSIDGFRYQAPLGLTQTAVAGPSYAGATIDTTVPAGGEIVPCLGVLDLGFNDLSNVGNGTTPAYWTEYVRRGAAAFRAAGISGLVLSGQLPYNANWPSYGAAVYAAQKAEALAQGLAFVDFFYPVGGSSLSYSGGTTNPHLTKPQYQAQADYLWDNLLGL